MLTSSGGRGACVSDTCVGYTQLQPYEFGVAEPMSRS